LPVLRIYQKQVNSMNIEEFLPDKNPTRSPPRLRGYLRKHDPNNTPFPDFQGDFYGMIFLEDGTAYQIAGAIQEKDGRTQVRLNGKLAPEPKKMLAWENGSQVEAVDFDYDAIDGDVDSEPKNSDERFWQFASDLLSEVMRFLTVPRTLAEQGARVRALALRLAPELIDETSLTEISRQLNGKGDPAALSKALLVLQDKFQLCPAHYQKMGYLRDVFRRSAIAAHQDRKANGSNGTNGSTHHKHDSEVQYLKDKVHKLEAELEDLQSRSILSLQERASLGGKAHKLSLIHI